MICPKCGKDNTNETNFCVACGESLQVSPYVEQNQKEQAVYTEHFSQGNPYITGMNPGQQNFNQQNMGMRTPVFTPQIQNNNAARTDRTSEFRQKDISNNKIYAMLPYLMGVVGVIIALLAAKKSKYVRFHVRQALKLTITRVILAIIAIPFVVLGMIPIAGILFILVAVLIGIVEIGVLILNLIGFFQVCEGMAKEPAIISGFEFLK